MDISEENVDALQEVARLQVDLNRAARIISEQDEELKSAHLLIGILAERADGELRFSHKELVEMSYDFELSHFVDQETDQTVVRARRTRRIDEAESELPRFGS